MPIAEDQHKHWSTESYVGWFLLLRFVGHEIRPVEYISANECTVGAAGIWNKVKVMESYVGSQAQRLAKARCT